MSDEGKLSVDDIIHFLKNEEELYGSFSTGRSESSEPVEEITITEEVQADEPVPDNKEKPQALEERLKACTTLDELKILCEPAEELRTDLEGTQLVFGVGNQNADLMLIGEAPGEEEDRQGEPFVGAAGQLLNKILAAINFERSDVYIANILKHRPPGNRNPNPEEISRSLPYLMRQIDLVDPKIILCLGKISALSLLNRDDALKNIRGKFFEFRKCELTATYHPAALLRNPKWKRPAWEDVQAVRKRYDELEGKP